MEIRGQLSTTVELCLLWRTKSSSIIRILTNDGLNLIEWIHKSHTITSKYKIMKVNEVLTRRNALISTSNTKSDWPQLKVDFSIVWSSSIVL